VALQVGAPLVETTAGLTAKLYALIEGGGKLSHQTQRVNCRTN
jgi:hypothetical protein